MKSFIIFLKWQIVSRIFPGIHQFDWVFPSKLYVSKSEASVTGNLYCGLMEFEEMSFLLHYLQSEDLFVDVGANSGSYTILASAVQGSSVISFEPVHNSFTRLLNNVGLNNVTHLVDLRKKAIGAEIGSVRISSDFDSTNRILGNQDSTEDSVLVEISTLDLEIQRIPKIVKIDVEGFESQVLAGASDLLKNKNLKAVIIELNGSGRNYGFLDSMIANTLVKSGFKAVTYEPWSRTLNLLSSTFNETGNTIFVRDLESSRHVLLNAKKFKIFDFLI
jgi:FkbM family methyltransferase